MVERTYTPLDYEPEDYTFEESTSAPATASPPEPSPSAPPTARESTPAKPASSPASRSRKYTPIEGGEPEFYEAPTGSGTALGRGFIGAAVDVKRMFGNAYEGFRVLQDPNYEIDFSPDPLTGYERKVPSLANIKDFDTGATWLGETLGAALPQWAPTIAGGAIGVGAGALTSPVTGPVGPFAGRMIGALGASVVQNYGDVWSGFKQDPGIRKALEKKEITAQQLSRVAAAASVLIGSLDAASLGKITNKLGLGEASTDVAKRWLISEITKRGAKAFAVESTTEALQSLIAQAAEVGLGGNWDIANRAVRLLDEFAAGGVQGAVTGAAMPATPPREGNTGEEEPPKDDDQPGESQPVLPEGSPAAPSDATAAEQATPGDLGAKTPAPPAGVEKQPPDSPPDQPIAGTDPRTDVKPPHPAAPATTVTVIESGQQAPDVAATLSAPVAAASASQDEGIIEGAIPESEEAATTNSTFMRQLLKNTQPNQDLAAAFNATATPAPASIAEQATQMAQQVPQIAPATPSEPVEAEPPAAIVPEPALPPSEEIPASLVEPSSPPGVAEVLQEREPAPPAEPAPAPPIPAETPVAAYTPIGYEPEDYDAEAADMAELGTEEAVSEQEPAPSTALAPKTEREPAAAPVAPAAKLPEAEQPKKKVTVAGVTAEEAKEKFAKKVPLGAKEAERQGRKEEVKPRSTPTPAEPKKGMTKAQRDLHAEVLQQVPPELETHRHGQAAIEEAVREHKAPVRPRTAKEREAQVKKTLESAERHAKRMLDEEVSTVGSQAQAEIQRAKEIARERETKGKPQERKRKGKTKGKAAEDVAIQSDKRWNEAVTENEAKPEGERNPILTEIGKLVAARNKLGARDKQRATYNDLIENARKRYVKELEQAEEAKAAAKPAPSPPPAAPAELTEAEKEAITEAQNKEAEKARAQAQAHRRNVTAPVIKPIIDSLSMPSEFYPIAGKSGKTLEVRKSPKFFDNELRDFIKKFHGNVVRAFKEAGLKLQERLNEFQSPEEQLAIFADRILKGKLEGEYAGMENTMFATALELYRAGDYAALWEQVSGEHRESGQHDVETPTHKRAKGAIQEQDEANVAEIGGMAARKLTEESRGDVRPRDWAAQPLIVKRPNKIGGGEFSATPLQTMSAAELLRKLPRVELPAFMQGPFNFIRKMHSKALRQMVGNTPVHIVSADDMYRATGNEHAAGLFMPLGTRHGSPGDLVAGRVTPTVLISEEIVNDPAAFTHVVMHELTHAATSYALRYNIRNTRTIIRKMMKRLEAELESRGYPIGSLEGELSYGFTNESEFVAEAFSNRAFQNLLMSLEAPAEIQSLISPSGRIASWWQAFAKAVSNALGIHVPRGTSYFEQVLKLHPELMMSTEEQRSELEQRRKWWFQKIFARPQATQPQMMAAASPKVHEAVNQSFDAARQAVADRWYNLNGRTIKNKLATTYEMMRRSDFWFGGPNNRFRDLARLLLSARNLRDKLASPGRQLVKRQLKFKLKNRKQYEEMSEVIHDSTLLGMDPRITLAENIAEGNVSKAGDLDANKRAAFPELQARYMKLSVEAKALFDATAEHHKNQENHRRTQLTRNSLDQIVDYYDIKLPTSREEAVNDIMGGLLDVDPAAMTDPVQAAKATALRAALGKHADSLAGVSVMRRIKGVYVPLMRWGKYTISATQKLTEPAGGTIDPDNPNQILFTDKKDYKAYANSTDDQIDRVVSEWWDPVTGTRTQKTAAVAHQPGVLTLPVQVFRVHVMNRLVEMDDNEHALTRRREALIKQGYEVSQVAITDNALRRGGDIMPSEINRLMNAMDNSAVGGATVGKEANMNALKDAYVRTLMGSRAQHRRLKRQGIQGFNRDLVTATNNANHIMAGHIANLIMSPKFAKADKALNDWIDQERKNDVGKSNRATVERQSMMAELRQRITNMQTRNEDHAGANALRNVLDLSFLTHLASPAYTIVNLMQTLVTTMPVLGAKFGTFAAGRAMARASRDLGVTRTVVRGVYETAREAANMFRQMPIDQYDHHKDARAKILKAEPDAVAGVDMLEEMGLSSSAGIEAPEVNEINRNAMSKFMGRTVRIARAAPEAAEAVNRYTTFLAVWRLARQSGMSIDEANEYAVSTVEQTQGGYASENNPAMMSNPWLKFPMQFKKYPLMFGQLYYGAVMRALGKNPSRADRIEAAKQTAYLSAMTVAFAGVGGLPFMEIGRALVLASWALSDDEDPWKWDDYENAMEEWFQDATKWALGQKSEMTAEAIMHGATRLLGIDTSSRMGNNSSILFGEPKKTDELGVKAWLFDLMGGAGLDTIADTIQAFQGDLTKIPMPKAFQDVIKAYQKANEGTVTKTGRQVGKKFTAAESIAMGLGFRPRKDVRSYEAGGSGTQHREEQRIAKERTSLMGEWATAKPHQRNRIWMTEILRWNRQHPKDKITRASLEKSLNRRKQQAKEDKKMREAAR